MADIERIKKEMESLTASNLVPVNKVERINNSDLEWKVVFDGPIASSYEDGIFLLNLYFQMIIQHMGLRQNLSLLCFILMYHQISMFV